MLLYAFFGWMKKKQRDKARKKIENQEGWDTGDIVEFGEGILDSIFDGDSDKEQEIADEKTIFEKDEDDLNIIIDDEKNDYEPEPILTEEKVIKPYFLKSISLVKISLMVFKTCCDTLSDLENGLLFNCLLMFF